MRGEIFYGRDNPAEILLYRQHFINTSDLQGKLKETTQTGAELIGDVSPEVDAEMIAMLVEALINCGLKEFQVSIGQIDFFKGLCEQARLDEDTELELRESLFPTGMTLARRSF